MIDNSLHSDDARMDEYLERAVRRGTQIRRRRRSLTQATAIIVAACAVIIPLGVLGNTTPTSQPGVDASAFRLVSWSRVAYPGLNFSDARYPQEMGCGSGYPSIFPAHVQQVTYIRPPGTKRTLALVLVKCESGTPTPSSLYAFAPGSSRTTPHLLQVLLAPPTPNPDVLWYAQHFEVVGNLVSLPARGVTGNAAICCPNISTTLRWRIEGDRFVSENHRGSTSTSHG
jgi:hypothetical protein